MASQQILIDTVAVGLTDLMLKDETDSADTFLIHTVQPQAPCSQEYAAIEFTSPKFSSTNLSAKVPSGVDFMGATYLHIHTKGIIGVKGDVTHSYPYTMETCEAGTSDSCLPSQERALADFELDFIDSGLGDQADADSVGSLTSNPYAHYVYGFGYRMFDKVNFGLGDNTTTQEITHWFMFVWDELTGGAGKRSTYQVMKYASREELIRASLRPQHLYVRVPFWWSHHHGTMLQGMLSQSTNKTVNLETAAITKLIVCSDSLTRPFVSQQDSTLKTWASSATVFSAHDRESSGTLFANDSIEKLELLIQTVFVSSRFRKVLAGGPSAAAPPSRNVLGLFTTHQSTAWSTTNAEQDIDVGMPQPCKAIYIWAQLDANRDSNNHYNLSRVGPEDNGSGEDYAYNASTNPHEIKLNQLDTDLIDTIQVRVNKQARWRVIPAEEARIVYPQVHHTALPDRAAGHLIYCIPIAQFPEDVSTYTGTLNGGRVDDFEVRIKMKTNKTDVGEYWTTSVRNRPGTIHVMALGWTMYNYSDHVLTRTGA